jgi:lipid A disaccharide synthetase
VLRSYAEIMGIRRRLAKDMIAERPDLFIGVDSGDFNLGLERRLKEAGIPTIHYVSPSVWAWRGWRVKQIARAVTRILVMFPFEKPLYEKAGVPVTYVGHPLADVIPLEPNKEEARAQLRLPAGKLIVALLPGSRRSELQYMASAFVLAAHRFRQEVRDVHFVCPTVTRATRDLFERAVHEHQRTDLPLTLLFGHSHEALAAADIERHGDARDGALQDADGDRLPAVADHLAPDARDAVSSLCRHAEHSRRRAARARAAAGRGDAARERQMARFREFHELLRQNAAAKAADAILAVLEGKHA